MTKPVIYAFAISHFCEKARWALDHLQIDYELAHPPVGVHTRLAKKLGAARSSLPILIADGQLVQGSAAIIDWADAAALNEANRLTPDFVRDGCRAIERRVDDLLRVHVRRFYYSEALIDHPETVRPIFTKDLPAPKEHALYASLEPPAEMKAVLIDWDGRPSFAWAREIYSAYR